MSKVLSVLIIIAALFTGVFIIFALLSRPLSKTAKTASSFVMNTQPQTTLFFEPAILRILPQDIGKLHTVSIGIDTDQNRLSSIQLELQFNPLLFGQVAIQPATGSAVWSDQYKVLYSRVDQTTGRVSFLFETENLQGKGPIATFSFIPQSASGSSKIIFLDKTMVTAQGTDLSVLKNTVPLDITTY
jgi:hypothetical protein